jgi:hypothetical protein
MNYGSGLHNSHNDGSGRRRKPSDFGLFIRTPHDRGFPFGFKDYDPARYAPHDTQVLHLMAAALVFSLVVFPHQKRSFSRRFRVRCSPCLGREQGDLGLPVLRAARRGRARPRGTPPRACRKVRVPPGYLPCDPHTWHIRRSSTRPARVLRKGRGFRRRPAKPRWARGRCNR